MEPVPEPVFGEVLIPVSGIPDVPGLIMFGFPEVLSGELPLLPGMAERMGGVPVFGVVLSLIWVV